LKLAVAQLPAFRRARLLADVGGADQMVSRPTMSRAVRARRCEGHRARRSLEPV